MKIRLSRFRLVIVIAALLVLPASVFSQEHQGFPANQLFPLGGFVWNGLGGGMTANQVFGQLRQNEHYVLDKCTQNPDHGGEVMTGCDLVENDKSQEVSADFISMPGANGGNDLKLMGAEFSWHEPEAGLWQHLVTGFEQIDGKPTKRKPGKLTWQNNNQTMELYVTPQGAIVVNINWPCADPYEAKLDFMRCDEPASPIVPRKGTAVQKPVAQKPAVQPVRVAAAAHDVVPLKTSAELNGSAGLTVAALSNMTYRLVDGKWVTTVTLVGAKGQTNEVDGGERFWLDNEHVAFGDLDGDGVDDAIVVLVSSGGGSGTFYQLVSVRQRNGIVETLAAKRLGDRIRINQINITNRVVAVDMITHGPDDPSCCPTERQVLKLNVQGSEFVPAQ
jgi:hypothetical protein